MKETIAPLPSFLASESWALVEDADAVLERARAEDPLVKGEGIEVKARPLPIYPEGRLLRLTCPAWERASVYYYDHGGVLYRLMGSSGPIHDANAKIGVQLNDENVLFYLSYFCFFVHGDEGPFYIVDDLSDPGLGDFGPTRTTGAGPDGWTAAQLFREPRLFGRNEEGHWRMSALVHYGDALFLADLVVQPTGMIQMANDEPLMADLPHRVDLPLWPPR